MTLLVERLQELGEALLHRTAEDRLLALSEGFIKVRCAEAALDLGWTLQEGVGNKGVADFARIIDGKVRWDRGSRMLFAPEGSADLAVVAPFSVLLEIKARPDHGTKSQAQFGQMDEDVARVARDPLCAFLAFFEMKAYRSFSAEKQESRGRRALMAEWFNRNFQKAASIPADAWLNVDAERGDTMLSLLFRKAPHTGADETILVLGCQKHADAVTTEFSPRKYEFDLLDRDI